ncbi:MAG: Xaa-Pro peptidase family protein [Peptococcaceae bacterium]|nr:Xaa-Pro peptidase family protein [Peptococcaceae bacterium]
MAYGKYAVDYEQRINYDRLRKERLEKAQKQMEQDGIGAIITFSADNIRYLTSYYVTTPLRQAEFQLVFCPRNGGPILFGGGTPSEVERRMPWMRGRIFPSLPNAYVAAGSSDNPAIQKHVDTVAELMHEHGLSNEPVGIDGTVLSMLYAEAFAKKGIKAVYAKQTMDNARMVKTVDEIEILRIAAANTEKAFAAVADAIRPGIRECDLVGIGLKALYEEGVDHTEDFVCMSGYNTNPYNWSFTDKPIRPGDLIYIDVDGAAYQGYKTCVYRTFCCGKATQKQKDLYAECLELLRAGIDVLKPGKTNYDIMAAFPKTPETWGWGPEDWGQVDPYCVAHGIGLGLHDKPLATYSYVRSKQPEIELKPGMVLAIETYAGKRGEKDGVRLEEMVLITEKGNEVLSRFPINELMECWRPY